MGDSCYMKRCMLSTRLIAPSCSFYTRPMLCCHHNGHPILLNWNIIIRIMYSGVWFMVQKYNMLCTSSSKLRYLCGLDKVTGKEAMPEASS